MNLFQARISISPLCFGILVLVSMLQVEKIPAEELEIRGHFEHQFFPQEMDGELILQDYSKLRLDMAADAGENVSFTGDVVYRVFHGKTEFSAFDWIPGRVVGDYAAAMGASVEDLAPEFRVEMADEHFLDNAFVSLYFARFDLRLGRQQLPWGTGYTWNPTDIFNDKNLLDPTYEKVGVNAIRAGVPLGLQGMLTGVVGIGDNWDGSTKALKIKGHLRGFDLSACLVEKEEEGIDYFTFAEQRQRRRLLGADFSGTLLGLGVWGEGAFNFMEEEKDFGQYLVGADYTFENGLFLTGEYYRNGRGKSDEARYTFADWMRLLSADGENLGCDYLFLGQSLPIGELWDGSNYAIANLNDKSGVIFPWISYSFGDNTEVDLVGYIPFGGKETEFGAFGAGGFTRVRVYF